ncbi:hypothetical protein [Halosimplex salinum]|uniref:hypothetical protein n=1 Tax=Halosimplex salinum TaxID=1710538 RepID=UPI000F484A69|nr:hypothetical protein [Halosimplex salinum]
MTGQTQEKPGGTDEPSLGTLDHDSIDRIDVHLQRALAAEDGEKKDFHVRHARQLLEACRE